jgi:hypothetical protein
MEEGSMKYFTVLALAAWTLVSGVEAQDQVAERGDITSSSRPVAVMRDRLPNTIFYDDDRPGLVGYEDNRPEAITSGDDRPDGIYLPDEG